MIATMWRGWGRVFRYVQLVAMLDLAFFCGLVGALAEAGFEIVPARANWFVLGHLAVVVAPAPRGSRLMDRGR